MKNGILIIMVLLFTVGCKEKAKKEVEKIVAVDVLNEAEEWTVLFDGSSFDGWHIYAGEGVPEVWTLDDGAMVYTPSGEGHGDGANLVTDKDYTDFVLSLEWRISEGGNSGIFWGVKEDENLSEAYQTGPEIQILDNEKHPDAKAGTTHQAGALYDMVAPSKDVTNPVGEWNTNVITINHKTNEGIIVLNGVEIVTFSVNDPEWSEMVSTSKFADWETFGKYTTGKIGLQDHGNEVAFRNIKIKEL
ncbi:MAG: glycosyl hydrolase [Flavobacteriaceae bacterium]|nr:MAG: glycosyl hydrolase [Flavobacteriaceae bacterium]